jgi:hypothetical protein
MKKFLKTYPLPKLNHEEIGNLNRAVTSKEVYLVIKTVPRKKSPGPDGFTGEFYQTFKNEPTPILPKLFQETEGEGNCHNSLHEVKLP